MMAKNKRNKYEPNDKPQNTPMNSYTDVEFANEYADANDFEAQRRADQADKRAREYDK